MCGYPTGDSCTRIGADAGCRTASIVFGCIGNAKRCAPLRRANPADSGPGTDPAHRGSLGFHSTPVNRAGGFTPAAGLRAASFTTFARRKRDAHLERFRPSLAGHATRSGGVKLMRPNQCAAHGRRAGVFRKMGAGYAETNSA